jgi:hypothetical protein
MESRIAAVLLAVLLIVQVTSALGESQTYDEAVHLAAGYSYLKTGDYRLNREHPPLAKILCALPLLIVSARLPLEESTWRYEREFDFATSFLYYNRVPANTLLLLGRSVVILMTLALGAAIVWWTRRRFGAAAALLALLLYCFDPNIIAHGRYITTDLPAALFYFLTCVLWAEYLESRATNTARAATGTVGAATVRERFSWLLAAGLALGCALASKFSMVLLPGVLVLLCALHWIQKGGRPVPQTVRLAASLAALATLALVVVIVAYWPERRTLRLYHKLDGILHPSANPTPKPPLLYDFIDRSNPFGDRAYRLARFTKLPAHPYWRGLYGVISHNREGHSSYLLGRVRDRGTWWYFPVAFLVKTPSAVLILLLACIVGSLIAIARGGLWRRFRDSPFAGTVLICGPVCYFAATLFSSLNLGLRHLLPVYPFLHVALGVALATAWRQRSRLTRGAIGVLLALNVIEIVAIYPHYTAFFNALCGGPSRGHRYLLDSNLDWGQDLLRLARYVHAQGNPPVCLHYFGSARPDYYGLRVLPLPFTEHVEERKQLDCLASISVNILQDLYVPPGSYSWLRAMKPAHVVGYTTWVYDLRKPAGSK